MSEKLIVHFSRLEREGQASMADIIALTSSHLYGVVFRILGNDADASKVLAVVYEKIHDAREGGYQTEDPVNALRAIAHRYAIDYKYTGRLGPQNDTLVELRNEPASARWKAENLSEADSAILQDLYKSSAPQQGAGAPKNLNPHEIRENIESIVSNMTRDKS